MDKNEIIDIQICPEEEHCIDQTEMPSAMEMAKNLMTDGGKILKNAIKGNKTMVDDETREQRWKTCTLCPFLQNDRCTKCGCFMKVKVAFAATECPERKW